MYRKHRIFFLFGLILVFALLFLYIIYEYKYQKYFPKTPWVDYRIPASDSVSYYNTVLYDFENVGNNMLVSDSISFSEKKSAKSNGKYSIVIQKPLSEFHGEKYIAARYGAWLFFNKNSQPDKGKLIFQIVDKNNKPRFSCSSDIDEAHGIGGEWFYVCGLADFKALAIEPEDIIKMYFWSENSQEIYLDDAVITLGSVEFSGTEPLLDNRADNYIFTQQRNMPPYPFVYFEKQNSVIVSHNSPQGASDNFLQVFKDDLLISGKFFNAPGYNQQLVVFRKGIPVIISWFEQAGGKQFIRKINTDNLPEMNIVVNPVTADIDGDRADEVLFFSETSKWLGILKYKPANTSFYLYEMEIPINKKMIAKPHQIIPVKSSDNNKIQILIAEGSGALNLYATENEKWVHKTSYFVPEANTNKYYCQYVSGNFNMEKQPANLLLFYQDKTSGKAYYQLYEINSKQKNLTKILHGNFDNQSDTLYPQNKFFICDIDNDGFSEFISYNDSRRHDFKIIACDKKGLYVVANIDFTGYDKDNNPKYYEFLSIASGNFAAKDMVGLMLVYGMNKKNSTDYGMDLYNFKKNKPGNEF